MGGEGEREGVRDRAGWWSKREGERGMNRAREEGREKDRVKNEDIER